MVVDTPRMDRWTGKDSSTSNLKLAITSPEQTSISLLENASKLIQMTFNFNPLSVVF